MESAQHKHDQDRSDAAGEVIGELSLERALLDFEVANARAIDLTQRLLEVSAELQETRAELDRERTRRLALEASHEAMKGSQAWKLASRIWSVRNALGI